MANLTIEFDLLRLTVNATDRGGLAYRATNWFEEYRNPFYSDVQRVLQPRWVFDIGANYGLTALFARMRFPDARIVAAEPNEAVIPYLRRNIDDNGVADIELFEGFVGDQIGGKDDFHIQPISSQDCRVRSPGDGWVRQTASQTTFDALAAAVKPDEGVYIKIDTQGYEERVFRGGEGFFGGHDRWLAKSEFAPDWLRSQGTDPLELLNYFVDRYVVAESFARVPFGRATIKAVLDRPLAKPELADFLDHVEGQNRQGLGWVDLIIAPRSLGQTIAADPA